jgi:hypothetical protein
MKPASEESGNNTPVEPTYRAFVLRCWQETEAEPGYPTTWRFRLLEQGVEETGRGFASLEALLAYLRQKLATS